MISIRQVEVIRAVMVARSISGAAQLLNVSPAAVSRMLRHTESQIGFPLFSRTPNGFVPMPEAHAVLDDLEQVHSSLARIEARLAGPAREDAALRIGTSPGLGLSVVPGALSALRARQPQLRFELGVMHVNEVLPLLEFRRYDFALTIYEIEDPRLDIRQIAQAPLVCLMSKDHPLAGRAQVTLEEIAAHPMIGYDPQAFQQRLIDGMFRSRSLTPDYHVRCRLMNTACVLVQENLGITLLDRFTVQGRLPEGTCVAAIDIDYSFPLNVISMRDAPLSREGEGFLAEVERLVSA
ncbi:LysR family transcriptional regulator [Oceanicola sp. 502str15]|uniref:LysR family transcriptional regulator n=1 Tax=Oceanicola sp. 502str15 TaxID=2696061 RepID=UPI0020942878|nr:LysR family transcriptional regulator [Oceanicola sp. 502str15]MCO6383314.1 LysR family transcriptional regulator [Oceanicola sp. 502str15]